VRVEIPPVLENLALLVTWQQELERLLEGD
jgi:hypothetical protein